MAAEAESSDLTELFGRQRKTISLQDAEIKRLKMELRAVGNDKLVVHKMYVLSLA